jgi:hypothetical protein
LVTLIDHTAASALRDFSDNFQRAGRGIVQIAGLDQLRGRSRNELCLRVSAPVLAQERSKALAELARLSLTANSLEAPGPVAFLEQISLTHVGPIPGQDDHVITTSLFRASRYLARQAGGALVFVRTLGIGDGLEVVADTRDLECLSLTPTGSGDAPGDARGYLTPFAAPPEPGADGGRPYHGLM